MLTACSQITVIDEQQALSWQQRQTMLRQLDHWVVSGRVAITTSEDGWNATLYWKQFPNKYEIKVIAPFGGGTVMLQGNRSGVMLYAGDAPPEFADNATRLLAKRLGWHLPVESLRYWMLGLPDPNIQQQESMIEFDRHNRLSNLFQSGWKIQFLRYQRVNGYELPGKIFLENDELSVKMVIQEWNLKS